MLRRNFATHLYTLGFPIEWCQYYMGHLIEDDVLKRSDFNDDGFLYEMALLLDKHPLNEHTYSPKSLFISETDSRYQYITIANRELNDPLSITINCSGRTKDLPALNQRSFCLFMFEPNRAPVRD